MLDMNIGLTDYASDTAAANTTATVTLAGAAKPSRWSIGGLAWSYAGMTNIHEVDSASGTIQPTLDTSAGIYIHQTISTDTTGGVSLGRSDTSGSLVFGMEITVVGAGDLIFSEPVKFAPGYRIHIVLADGGGSHRLNILGAKLV